MKQFYYVLLSGIIGCALLEGFTCKSETKVPCMIFSGDAEKNHAIDLASLNRITFGNNSMKVSSSKEPSVKPVELPYSLYHRLEIGNSIPTIETSVESISDDSLSRIYVDDKEKLLCLTTLSPNVFLMDVFDINGRLLLTTDVRDGDCVTLESLLPGIYVAVATDGQCQLNLKFILN